MLRSTRFAILFEVRSLRRVPELVVCEHGILLSRVFLRRSQHFYIK